MMKSGRSLFTILIFLFLGADSYADFTERFDMTEVKIGAVRAYQGGGNSSGGFLQYVPQYTIEAGPNAASFGLDLGYTSFKNEGSSYFSVVEYGVFEAFRFQKHYEVRLLTGAQTWSDSIARNGTALFIEPSLEYRFRENESHLFEGIFVFYDAVFQHREARLVGLGITLHWPTPRTPFQKEQKPVAVAPVSPTLSPTVLPVPIETRQPNSVLKELTAVIPTKSTENGLMIAIESGAFDVGSSFVGAVYTAKLQEIARVLTKYRAKLRIEGYTDAQGPEARNLALSRHRADRVKTILVDAGLKEADIEAVGLGSAKPIDDNSTEEGRTRNRRVEVLVH